MPDDGVLSRADSPFRITAPPRLDVVGVPLEEALVQGFAKPRRTDVRDGLDALRWIPESWLDRFGKELIHRPIVNEMICTGCGRCVKSCPENAVALKNQKAEMDHHRCIRCWCCHEVCPNGAVELEQSLLGRLPDAPALIGARLHVGCEDKRCCKSKGFEILSWIFPGKSMNRDHSGSPPLKKEMYRLLDVKKHPFWRFSDQILILAPSGCRHGRSDRRGLSITITTGITGRRGPFGDFSNVRTILKQPNPSFFPPWKPGPPVKGCRF